MGSATESFKFSGSIPRTSSMVRIMFTVLYEVETTAFCFTFRALDECHAAMSVDVIAAVLGVILNYEDQRIAGV